MLLGVLAALGLRDNKTKDVVEIWWHGKTSNTIVVNGRHKNSQNIHIEVDKKYGSEKEFGLLNSLEGPRPAAATDGVKATWGSSCCK